MYRPSTVLFLLAIGLTSTRAQIPPARPTRPTPPTRDAHTPGYVMAKELPDGENAPATVDGNFILGPTHNPAPETIAKEGVPRGTTKSFTLTSKESTIYNPGLIRDDVAGCTNSSIMTTVTAPNDANRSLMNSGSTARPQAVSEKNCRMAPAHSAGASTGAQWPTCGRCRTFWVLKRSAKREEM